MSNAPAGIDSIIIATQGQGDYSARGTYGSKDFGKFPLFDNLKVCRVNADGTDGELIYSCDFRNSVRVKAYDGAVMAAAIDRPGVDGWIQRGPNDGLIYAGGDANPAVVLDDIDGPCYAVQSLGMTSKGCAQMKITVDLRPPTSWTRKDGSFGVEIGGDAYYQGNLGAGAFWRDASRLSMGFSDTADGADASGTRFTSRVLVVGTTAGMSTSTATVDPTHWYRFRVRVKPSQRTFSVTVYDQGSVHPLPTDADGTVVATFTDVGMPFDHREPMTSIGLFGCGLAGTLGGSVNDPDVALVDNLSVSGTRLGLTVIVR